MPICPNCKKEVEADTVFCGYCGTKIPLNPVIQPEGNLSRPSSEKQPASATVKTWFFSFGVVFVLTSMMVYPFMLACDGQRIPDILRAFINPLNIFYGWMITSPFLILAAMAFLWSVRKKDIPHKEFVPRAGGLLLVYFSYAAFTVYLGLLMASAPGALIGFILYPISMPVIIPLLYWAGYSAVFCVYGRKGVATVV